MNFEEFFNNCFSSSQNSNNSNEGCNDIPGGFQDLNPELFTILGTIVGEIMSGNMPINVQNAVGNWLELVGQIILTYNAQQQYFESGPGLYFNCKNKNINNSNCDNNSNSNSDDEIQKLKDNIKELANEIEKLKIELKNLKNC